MINVFEMVVLIVAIVTIGKLLRDRARAGHRLPAGRDAAVDTENQRLQAEVARLNERIHVLERLATDPAKRLSDEIEALKHQ